jgi:hypothetical protein
MIHPLLPWLCLSWFSRMCMCALCSCQHGARFEVLRVLLQVRFEAAASLASKAFSSEEVQVRGHSTLAA